MKGKEIPTGSKLKGTSVAGTDLCVWTLKALVLFCFQVSWPLENRFLVMCVTLCVPAATHYEIVDICSKNVLL